VAALGGDLDAVEECRAVGTLAIALVGVEPHLAVPQRAERLPFGTDAIADHHHLVPFRRVVALGACRRLDARGDRSEVGGEAALVGLGQVLAAEHQHRMGVPGILDPGKGVRIERMAQIDAFDLGADHRVKLPDLDGLDRFGCSCHRASP